VNAVVPQVQAFKFQHFGHDIIVLHEREIRKQKPPFVFLQNQQKRAVFMDGLNRLIELADFTIVAAVIDKTRLRDRYNRPKIRTSSHSVSAWKEPMRSCAISDSTCELLISSWKDEGTEKTTNWNSLFDEFGMGPASGDLCQDSRSVSLTRKPTPQDCRSPI
jgi:hypothetical protein